MLRLRLLQQAIQRKRGLRIPNQLLHGLGTVVMASGKDAVLPCAAAAFLICASKAWRENLQFILQLCLHLACLISS
ncbi:hypothetical protein COCNU_12G000820 [Cocos nucifera]|uniref:Uncharacterized protein n=1 Tax=Cocos nucifera TaxID=13894 RepID=A0A8K0ISA5_COCNU|nr:hypothetical protein COCNU_12G000820 [Cocos nucifera]